MSVFTIILVLVGVYACVEGVFCIIKGKPLTGGKSNEKAKEKYTPESLKKYNRISGIFVVICGLAIIAYDLREVIFFFQSANMLLVTCIIVVACIVITIILYRVIPKKKVPGVVYEDESGKATNKVTDNDEYIDED